MSESDLIMWLSGFLEMRDGPLTKEETKCIKDHLALVVTKVTPEYKIPIPNKITAGQMQQATEEARQASIKFDKVTRCMEHVGFKRIC